LVPVSSKKGEKIRWYQRREIEKEREIFKRIVVALS